MGRGMAVGAIVATLAATGAAPAVADEWPTPWGIAFADTGCCRRNSPVVRLPTRLAGMGGGAVGLVVGVPAGLIASGIWRNWGIGYFVSTGVVVVFRLVPEIPTATALWLAETTLWDFPRELLTRQLEDEDRRRERRAPLGAALVCMQVARINCESKRGTQVCDGYPAGPLMYFISQTWKLAPVQPAISTAASGSMGMQVGREPTPWDHHLYEFTWGVQLPKSLAHQFEPGDRYRVGVLDISPEKQAYCARRLSSWPWSRGMRSMSEAAKAHPLWGFP